MKVFRSRGSFLKWRGGLSKKKSIGFVPTMGALHLGHLSLVEQAKRQCDLVIVSIFVNPTQFGPNEDFKKYPRTEAQDLRLLKGARIDAVLLPKVEDIYLKGEGTVVIPRPFLTRRMEGKFRPGHFTGVATVVSKLFELILPHRAYFGEKDFQQLRVIEAMVEDFFIPIKIVRCPTIRERTGLALSSRNRYLTEEERKTASQLYQVLRYSSNRAQAKERLKEGGFRIQYLEIWNKNLESRAKHKKGRWLIAAYFQGVRLIDNVLRT